MVILTWSNHYRVVQDGCYWIATRAAHGEWWVERIGMTQRRVRVPAGPNRVQDLVPDPDHAYRFAPAADFGNVQILEKRAQYTK